MLSQPGAGSVVAGNGGRRARAGQDAGAAGRHRRQHAAAVAARHHFRAQPWLSWRGIGRHPEAEPGRAHPGAARQCRADLARGEGRHQQLFQPAGAGCRRADPAQGPVPQPDAGHHGRRSLARIPQWPADQIRRLAAAWGTDPARRCLFHRGQDPDEGAADGPPDRTLHLVRAHRALDRGNQFRHAGGDSA